MNLTSAYNIAYNNTTTTTTTMVDRDQLQIIIPVIFGIGVLVGCVGNALVILVVLRNKTMRNTPNILILNLAVTDFLFLVICIPFTGIYYTTSQWLFGDFWCKIVFYLIYVTIYVSIYTLVLLAISRYLAIVHSMKSLVICTRRNTFIAIAVMWVVILTANTYLILAFDYNTHDDITNNMTHIQSNVTWHISSPSMHESIQSKCINLDLPFNKRIFQIYAACLLIVGYTIPLMAICILYALLLKCLLSGTIPGEGGESSGSMYRKKGVIKMVGIVVAVFAVCWFPTIILFMIQAFTYAQMPDYFYYMLMAGNGLAYMNSSVNPIIYAFFSQNFRLGFKAVLCCRVYERRDSDSVGRMSARWSIRPSIVLNPGRAFSINSPRPSMTFNLVEKLRQSAPLSPSEGSLSSREKLNSPSIPGSLKSLCSNEKFNSIPRT